MVPAWVQTAPTPSDCLPEHAHVRTGVLIHRKPVIQSKRSMGLVYMPIHWGGWLGGLSGAAVLWQSRSCLGTTHPSLNDRGWGMTETNPMGSIGQRAAGRSVHGRWEESIGSCRTPSRDEHPKEEKGYLQHSNKDNARHRSTGSATATTWKKIRPNQRHPASFRLRSPIRSVLRGEPVAAP